MAKQIEKRRINIMTSCDENYAQHVPVQLLSIADSLIGNSSGTHSIYEVHFYFFYSNISEKRIEYLRSYSDNLGIIFHEIYIDDTKLYAELASKGGGWTYEAYFTVECHRYLQPDVERIIYIDAADVLIIGDIGEYYFSDFGDCSIITTCSQYKKDGEGKLTAFERDDLGNEELRLKILRGTFNSGSYVINIEKMRRENMTLNDYIALKTALENIYPDKSDLYFGDQGLLSAAFVGDIKYFGYPETKNLWFQPYNFCIWFFDNSAVMCGGNPWYVPRILHFSGAIKPWKFTNENEKELKPGQWPFYKIYKLYANQVPAQITL